MEEFSVARAIIVFFSMVLVDILYVLYTRRTAQGKAFAAALAGMLIALCAAYVIKSYVQDVLYIIPTALGSFAGTYFAVKIDTREKPKE